MGPGVNHCGRKWFKAFQKTKMSLRARKLTLSAATNVLSGHSKKKVKNSFSRPIITFKMQVKSIAECSKGSILLLSTFITLPFVIKIVFCSLFEWSLFKRWVLLLLKKLYLLRQVIRTCVFAYTSVHPWKLMLPI